MEGLGDFDLPRDRGVDERGFVFFEFFDGLAGATYIFTDFRFEFGYRTKKPFLFVLRGQRKSKVFQCLKI